ncbi:MAG: hypothetical protein IJ856_07515, partial [Candidatus Methanomethylophilaceae archaeon]|nr:hypothetical protein [Candidatus Methanomethylophilaceae archaeon]
MPKAKIISVLALAVLIIAVAAIFIVYHDRDKGPVVAEGLPEYAIKGETDLDGNFFISFVYSKNLIMLDGKGNVVWSMHKDPGPDGVQAGCWDFKKHVVDGKTYYSYHDQISSYDKYGIEGYAPGDRDIMDSE